MSAKLSCFVKYLTTVQGPNLGQFSRMTFVTYFRKTTFTQLNENYKDFYTDWIVMVIKQLAGTIS